ncbi:MAG: hypothetical protein J1F07_01550 [Muribaculaceae bacterium]|nr:hypothetical protein [Muribaculaceae bacterium]
MKQQRDIQNKAIMLLGLLLMGLLAFYVPHHHHDGIICMERADRLPTHDSSHEECQLDIPQLKAENALQGKHLLIEIQGVETVTQSYAPNAGEYEGAVKNPAFNASGPRYRAKAQKLRGSPLFS